MDLIRTYFENEAVLICEKPAGTSSEDGGLPDILCEQKNIRRLYTVHRLDSPVTGGILYAKTKEAAAAVSAQIADGTFRKTYIAVAEGSPAEDEGIWEDLLFYDRKQGKSYVVKRERDGVKKARLHYIVLGRYTDGSGREISLMELGLYTGRTHQIRIQLSSRKHPVLGDRRYGSREKMNGIALRSYRMEFTDPETGDEMKFTFPVPDEYPWNIFQQITNEPPQ